MGCASAAQARLDSSDGQPEDFTELMTQEDFHQRFQMGENLAKGSFGSVRALQLRSEDDPDLAVKVVNLHDASSSKAPELLARQARKEAKIWKSVSGHPNVVKLHALYMDPNRGAALDLVFFVMERCGPHLRLLYPKLLNNEPALAGLLSDLLAALSHVHARGIVHRDVKPENAILGHKGMLKLCDFGSATQLPKGFASSVVGTAAYMAPEVVKGQDYAYKVDTWSTGVIFYEVLYGTFPFLPEGQKSSAAFKALISAGAPPAFACCHPALQTPSSGAAELVRALLSRDAARRPSASEALRFEVLARSKDSKQRQSQKLQDSTASTALGPLPSTCSELSDDLWDVPDAQDELPVPVPKAAAFDSASMQKYAL